MVETLVNLRLAAELATAASEQPGVQVTKAVPARRERPERLGVNART